MLLYRKRSTNQVCRHFWLSQLAGGRAAQDSLYHRELFDQIPIVLRLRNLRAEHRAVEKGDKNMRKVRDRRK